MKKKYKSILVIKMSALGDIIHALPCLYELRKLYPEAKISWLVEPQFQEILPGKPYIDNKIIFYKNDMKKMSFWGKLSYLRSLRKELHSYNFDLVIDLQGLMKSTLIVLLSGCKERIGYCEMREGSAFFTKAICGANAHGHVVQRYLDVIRYLGADVGKVVFPLPAFAKEEAEIDQLLREEGLAGKYAVIFAGAGWVTKEWPLDRYAKLAEHLLKQNLSVVIAGGAADKSKAKQIKEIFPSTKLLDVTGKTTMMQIAGLVKRASLCVGGDTGPLHIAAAVGVPTVSLFGPSSYQRACPYGEKNVIVHTTAECSPCFKRKCPLVFVCMDLIGVPEVAAACDKILLNQV